MSSHKIIAEIPVEFRISGMPEDEHETAYPSVEITYNFAAGCPARIHWDENDHPAEPHEVELTSVKVLDADGMDFSEKEWAERASDWLDDKGYDAAVGLIDVAVEHGDRLPADRCV